MYYFEEFENNLRSKGTSSSTVSAYMSDINDFVSFLSDRPTDILAAGSDDIKAYISSLEDAGRSKSTVNRRIASLKRYYGFLLGEGIIERDPTYGSKASVVEAKEIVYLTEDEITKFVESPGNNKQGLRDRAILEMMYATGIKVSELCDLDLGDLNLNIGYISISSGEKNKGRVVPIGRYCKTAVKEYILKSRRNFLDGKDDKGALFLNHLGTRITRQGVWKILKKYSAVSGIEKDVTPQMIRDTFAVHLIQHGADLKTLQELLGHEDITATQIYLKFKKNRVMDVYNDSFPRA